ncbi:MAG TPA: hypothetical protein EYP30_02235 [Archaeoglobaceae archaeon]|nr:hypothetical protein [Archaeoglobaceae archaeon]
MRLLLFFLVFLTYSFGDKIITKDIINLYKSGEYRKACNYGFRVFEKFKNDENMVSLYGISCLKAGYVDRIGIPILLLKSSKSARANAALFSTILAQKKLLFYALFDNVDISSLVFPETDHIISKIFTLCCLLLQEIWISGRS